MTKTNVGLVDYCKVQLGRPYWFSCYGQKATRQLYEDILRRYPSQVGKWPKDSYMDQLGQRVHDCSGLIKGYMFSDTPESVPKYNSKYDLSSGDMIKACAEQGDISTLPEIAGLLLWKEGHVGVYIGGGQAIEAKGHSYGVVLTKNTKWVKWGKLPWLEYIGNKETDCNLDLPILTRGMKHPAVARVQMALNYLGYKGEDKAALDVDRSFGKNTAFALKAFKKANGLPDTEIVDAATWRLLITK